MLHLTFYDLGHSIKSSLCSYCLAGVEVLRIEPFYGSLLCGYYTQSPRCQGRDFMAIFYYSTVGFLLIFTTPSSPPRLSKGPSSYSFIRSSA